MAEPKCANCDSTFKKKGKNFYRTGFDSSVKLNAIDKTVKDVLEEELNLQLTPEQKKQRFLCPKCSWALLFMAKSRQKRRKARATFSRQTKGYLALKRKGPLSPYATPEKRKRLCAGPSNLQSPKPAKRRKSPEKPMKAVPLGIHLARAVKFLKRFQYRRAVKILAAYSTGFKKAMTSWAHEAVRQETQKLLGKKKSLFHGKKSLEQISNFSWDDRYAELKETCPLLTDLLTASVTSRKSLTHLGLAGAPTVSIKPTLGVLISIVLYQLQPRRMSDLQELIGLQLWMSGCKRQMFPRLNHLGLSVGIDGTKNVIDRVRKKYDDEVVQHRSRVTDSLLWSAELPPFRKRDADGQSSDATPIHKGDKGTLGYSLCFDNVNQRVSVRHQTRDKTNKQFNMVQAYAAIDRIPSLHLSDEQPSPADISLIPLEQYLPSTTDEAALQQEMSQLIERVLCTNMPFLHDLQSEVAGHIQHEFQQESSAKSQILPLGVLDKDESKVAEMVEIMAEYHRYVPLKPNGDPFTLPLYADGLSCERGNDAQNARVNGNSPWEQLQGLTMGIQEWHKRCLLLQDIFDELYSASSGREKGTLVHLKQVFNHRNVSSDCKQKFNHNEEFLEFCCDGYIVLAALHCMKTKTVQQTPENFPNSRQEQIAFIKTIAKQILNILYTSCQETVTNILNASGTGPTEYLYCVCKQDFPGSAMIFCENRNCRRGTWFHLECIGMKEDDVPDGKWYCCISCHTSAESPTLDYQGPVDVKRLYTSRLMWRGLNQKVRRDAIRENDGHRIILHWKFDMLEFFNNHHPKYFLFGHKLLSAVHGAVSERLQHTLTWNRTVNVNGGKGKNIAMDLHMEFLNKEYKESVKGAAGHLTADTVARHSQMVGVGKILVSVFEKEVSQLSRASVHTKTVTDRQKDIEEFVSILIGEDLFTCKAGRKHKSFQNMPSQTLSNIRVDAFKSRLLRQEVQ
ncbi:PREDICTED: uncharacterized protein LOC106818780 [Priapulus caudatus]|uniref:Uncharacterized protein LOC106818780 n=1 Tax=Priapulus caudatus TaxID=37621 RepID=A0ABM1F3B9_PRICU|nr:PREDICTED: uncharacterized protein LOC106818780 [Priapulus caudatus]